MAVKKFLKNIKKTKDQELVINAEDVAVLAYMCRVCAPCVVKRGLIPRRFAYYIPTEESDLQLAKDLFKKNGINMRVHFSHMASSKGQNALRMNYRYSKNYERDRDFFEQIKQKKRELFYNSVHEEEEHLLQRTAQLREQQR